MTNINTILVIGESNSVMRNGWVSGFSSFNPDLTIVNKSIGSTGIFNSIRVISESIDQGFDLIVVDSFINDSIFFIADPLLYRRILKSVFSSLSNKFKSRIVYLCFGGKYIDSSKLLLKKVLEEECELFGVYFFDVNVFLHDYASQTNCDFESTYSDDAHPKAELSFSLGLFLASHLVDLNIKIANSDPNLVDLFQVFCPATDSGFLNFPEITSRRITNSLVDLPVVAIDCGSSEITFEPLKGFFPLGFFFNAAGSKGAFKIVGATELVKNLGLNNFVEGSNIVWARPIHGLISPSQEGGYKIYSTDESSFEETEHCASLNSYCRNPSFELIYIIFVDYLKLFGDQSGEWFLSKFDHLNADLIACRAYSADYAAISKFLIGRLSGMENLALNAHASQSSLSPHSTADGAGGGCNGNITGGFGFHTDKQFNPWWMLDFEKIINVSLVVIYNRMDAASERANSLRLFVSDDGEKWFQIYNNKGKGLVGGLFNNSHNPLVIPFPSGFSLRFIKIDLPGEQILHLDEIQVF
ncbi:hypothetical protein LMORI2_12090 [Limnohabitans sp. MORI2]|uniref:discoidin domain-containing protein n=1 Tax=Limnohabitans sp. MORI2 TaxID=1751150 RepID=UPI0023772773|nr:discoidin domain-containing protein [Limnohabitans sp. MORI2]BDU58227.1 hypothetical protein LMORI2_12090 [Limnohabitans sp. MORI2]